MKILVILLLFGGLFFFTGGAIGILRFPDFYSRLHPAGKLDTAGQFMAMSAMALYIIQDFTLHNFLTATKIVLIVIFVYLTSPTATHALARAARHGNLRPQAGQRRTRR